MKLLLSGALLTGSDLHDWTTMSCATLRRPQPKRLMFAGRHCDLDTRAPLPRAGPSESRAVATSRALDHAAAGWTLPPRPSQLQSPFAESEANNQDSDCGHERGVGSDVHDTLTLTVAGLGSPQPKWLIFGRTQCRP